LDPMPTSNIDVVRAVVSAFNRGDLDTAMELCTDDVVFDWSRRMLDGEVLNGHEELRRFMAGIREIFDEVHIPDEELTDLGDGVVLLVGAARFKGHVSGLDVQAHAANLWTVRDGKVSHFRFYQTKEDALADV
jgi:ketosteroid isomerase-like protein